MNEHGLVLIVEDEPDLSAALEYALSREGFRTCIACEGRRALDIVRDGRVPELVLLDLMLPDMSGLEVCRELRALERTRMIPIIIATARAEAIDWPGGLAVGADDYVVKPFSLRELVLRCRAVLRRRRSVVTVSPLPQY